MGRVPSLHYRQESPGPKPRAEACYEAVSSRAGSGSRPAGVGVGREVRLAAPPIGDMRVPLGGREVGVAEHLLHRAEIGPALEQMGGERVAQQVRVDALGLEPCLRRELAEDQERACAGQRAAAGVQEQVGPVAAIEVRAAERQVAAHGLGRRPAERDDALLVTLADHPHDARVDVDRGPGQPHRLRDPQARAVHQLDECAVAHAPVASSRLPPRSGARTRTGRACAAACGSGAGVATSAAGLSARRPSRTWWRNAERTAAIRRAIVEGASPAARIEATQASSDSVVAVRGRRVEERGERCEIAAVGVDRSRRALRCEEEEIALYLGVGRLGGSSCGWTRSSCGGADPACRAGARLSLTRLRAADGCCRRPAAAAARRRGCRPGSSRAMRARAAPGSCAGRHRLRAGGLRRRGGACGDCA